MACKRPVQVFAHACDARDLGGDDELLAVGVSPIVPLVVGPTALVQ
jgi:hypothetical protein